MVLHRVVVVWRVCWLCVVPRRWWVWWQGLVVVEYVMVWCGDVRYVGWVVRGGLVVLGRGGDVAGGGRCSMGALGGRGSEGRGRGDGVGGAMSPGSARMVVLALFQLRYNDVLVEWLKCCASGAALKSGGSTQPLCVARTSA